MNVKINELMAKKVITAQRHHSVEHVRNMMARNRIHAIPVVGPDDEPVGIVTSADLLGDHKEASPISGVMTDRVYTVPAYNDVSVAARIMRKHKIHHVVVSHEKRVVGIISSFDLLKLVEDRRFVMKNPPEKSKKKRRE
ncbi:MAG: CBS domain-containing protein [Alphaproteobacteria bacterium]|nr:CBS domain-containing protein [Alphaproteobacteria bacterium]